MKRYVMIVVSPARPTPTARAAAACPSSCVDPARESSRRACSVPRTPTARHRTCQPPLGGGVTSSAAIDAGRGGVSETGALRCDLSPIPSGHLGDLVFSFGPAGIAGGVFFVGAMPQSRRRAPTSRHERRPVGAPSPTDQPAALPRGKPRWPAGCTRDVRRDHHPSRRPKCTRREPLSTRSRTPPDIRSSARGGRGYDTMTLLSEFVPKLLS